jgi:hypothetical protein
MKILFYHQIFSWQKYAGISQSKAKKALGWSHKLDIDALVSWMFDAAMVYQGI